MRDGAAISSSNIRRSTLCLPSFPSFNRAIGISPLDAQRDFWPERKRGWKKKSYRAPKAHLRMLMRFHFACFCMLPRLYVLSFFRLIAIHLSPHITFNIYANAFASCIISSLCIYIETCILIFDYSASYSLPLAWMASPLCDHRSERHIIPIYTLSLSLCAAALLFSPIRAFTILEMHLFTAGTIKH